MTDMRWRGHKHETLHNWINSGEGARAATPQLEYWENLKGALGDIGQRLSDSLNKVGSSWEGKAGESAQRGLTPMHQWAESAKQAAHHMRQSAQDQADHVSTARAKMPEPVDKPTGGPTSWPQEGGAPQGHGKPANPAAAVAKHGKDLEGVERAAADSSERAVQVMNQYQAASEHNAGTLAQFSAPPDIQIEVGDAVVSGGGAVGGLRKQAPRPGHNEVPTDAGKSPTEQAAAFTPNHPAGADSAAHPQPHAQQPAASASSPGYTEGAAGTMGASAVAGAVGGQLAPKLRPGGFSGAVLGSGGSNRGSNRERAQHTSQPVQSGGSTDAATNASSAGPAQSGPGQQGHAGGTPVPPGGGGAGGGFNSGDVTRGANPYLANRGLSGGAADAHGFDPLGEAPAEGGYTDATAQSETGTQSGAQQAGHQVEQQPHAGGGFGAPEMGGHGAGGGMPPAAPAGGGGAAGGAGGEEVHQNSFLVEADNVFDDEAIRVAPPVIGEDH